MPASISIPDVAGAAAESFDLICACATTQPNSVQRAWIANFNWNQFDTAKLLDEAEIHGLLPLVAENLGRYARNLPEVFDQALAKGSAENCRRNLWFGAELSRIASHLAASNIEVIAFKGPMLAQTAYGDLALRSFSDLDFLVRPGDLERARQALAELGYTPSENWTASVERFWLKYGYEQSFDGVKSRHLIELQWSIVPRLFAFDLRRAEFRIEDLFDRSTIQPLGWDPVHAIRALSPEDSLLMLCLHAAKHLWTRLGWVVDIAETLRRDRIDCALVVQRARQLGAARITGVGLTLARNLLACDIPEGLDLLLEPAQVQTMAAEYGERLREGAGYNFDSPDYFKRVLRLRERAKDKLRFAFRLLWTPGPNDLKVVSLPEPLFPLYRAIRLGRLVRRIVRMGSSRPFVNPKV